MVITQPSYKTDVTHQLSRNIIQQTFLTKTVKTVQNVVPLSASSSVLVAKVQNMKKHAETKNVFEKPQTSLAIA